MAKQFARAFYNSSIWHEVREAALKRDFYLCRICGAPAEEVHHIVHLTPDNIHDDRITMSLDNLESLCRDCHMRHHEQERKQARRDSNNILERIQFDERGYPIPARGQKSG